MNSERAFVWLGGALFVASLAFCAFSYLVRWSSAAAGGGWTAVAVNALLFSVFALHHSLFARDGVKRRVARNVPERLRRSVYVWTAALLLIVTCAAWRRIGGEIYHVSGVRNWLLVAVQLFGVWLIARAVDGLDPLELAGIHSAAAAGGLKTSGVYGWVRHPLYFGWLLAAFSPPHMTGDRLAFAAISSCYLVVAVPWEERSLVRSFGDQYLRYQKLVRWRMIPFIY